MGRPDTAAQRHVGCPPAPYPTQFRPTLFLERLLSRRNPPLRGNISHSVKKTTYEAKQRTLQRRQALGRKYADHRKVWAFIESERGTEMTTIHIHRARWNDALLEPTTALERVSPLRRSIGAHLSWPSRTGLHNGLSHTPDAPTTNLPPEPTTRNTKGTSSDPSLARLPLWGVRL
jgi:hypothetical protein